MIPEAASPLRRPEPLLRARYRRHGIWAALDKLFRFANRSLLFIIPLNMSPRGRTARRLVRAFLPILFIIVLVVVLVAGVIVYGITRPPHAAYLVTPQSLSSKVAGPILKATDETWK